MKKESRTYEALKLLSEHPNGIAVRLFGLRFWPDNVMHSKVFNTGRGGACKGKAGWLCAGSFLSKLKRKGLVDVLFNEHLILYKLSNRGRTILRDTQ